MADDDDKLYRVCVFLIIKNVEYSFSKEYSTQKG